MHRYFRAKVCATKVHACLYPKQYGTLTDPFTGTLNYRLYVCMYVCKQYIYIYMYVYVCV